MSAAWLAAATALATAAGTLLLWSGQRLWRFFLRVLRFLDDWAGEEPRPGVPGRPGVMVRLQETERIVTEVRAETRPNGGTSLRDVLHKTAADVTDIKREQARTAAAVSDIKDEQARVAAELARMQQEGKHSP